MKTLQQVIEYMGYETRSYSGRGMMGRECLGVEMEWEKVNSFLLELGYELCEAGIALPRHVHRDAMGRGEIVYFPRVEHGN